MTGSRLCLSCGQPLAAGVRFCGGCGAPVGPGLARQADRPDDASGAETEKPRRWSTRAALQSDWPHLKSAILLWVSLLVIIGLFAAFGGDEAGVSLWAMVGADVAMAVVTLVAVFSAWKDQAPLLRHSGINARTWWASPVVLAFFAAFMFAYMSGLRLLGLDAVAYLEDFRAAGWPLWSAFALISFSPGLFEELAFRGFIMERLIKALGRRDGLIVQAAMFSILHLSPAIFISHFVLGLGLGWLRLRTQSLWPGVLVHMIWNALVLVEEL